MRIGNADVSQSSPNDIVPQTDNQVMGSIFVESFRELLSNPPELLQITNSNSLGKTQ